MKKVIIMVVMVIMTLSLVACKTENKTETRQEYTARVLTSWTEADSNGKSTVFRFNNREDATDFMYYWLDYGETVSGVIEHTTEPKYYTVEIMEPEFNDVVHEVIRAL
jgi:curli biogenesis system outer membrane secretion channel CsgG